MKPITKGFYGLIVTGVLSIAIMAGCGKDSTTAGDTAAPANTTASNFISSGAASTSSTTATLAISANDNVGVTGYYASEASTAPSASSTGWTAVTSTTSYSANVSFTLSNVDGIKTIYVWFKDAAGNVSAATNDTISLAQATNPLVGTSYDSSNGNVRNVNTNLSDGTYMHLTFRDPSTPIDCVGGTGMELGTYTATTNTYTITSLSVDTDGCDGASNGIGIPMSYVISGNQVTMSGTDPVSGNTFSSVSTIVVEDPANPLIGSWHGTATGTDSVVLTFYDDGTYTIGQNGPHTGSSDYCDATAGPDAEMGTYTSTSSILTITGITFDVNCRGFSVVPPVYPYDAPYTISGNQLTLSGGYTFTRVQYNKLDVSSPPSRGRLRGGWGKW